MEKRRTVELARKLVEKYPWLDNGLILKMVEGDVKKIGDDRAFQFIFIMNERQLNRIGLYGLRMLVSIRKKFPDLFFNVLREIN